MLTGVHVLLTYACTRECDHCFLYCGPRAEGTFTLAQLRDLLDQAKALGSVEWVFFEGGEPFLHYPLLLEGLRQARARGFRTGVVTNSYWATCEETARLWLAPLAELGVADLSLSHDAFHADDDGTSPADRAAAAAEALGLPVSRICIEPPRVEEPADGKGAPVVGGGALLKGRAADTLIGGLPTRPVEDFAACEHEELVAPERVHVDPFGDVQICQGLSIGNVWERPLGDILDGYDATKHPIAGPLSRGGPAALAQAHGVDLPGSFVSACHHCFLVRRTLLDRFPSELAPAQVYGETGAERLAGRPRHALTILAVADLERSVAFYRAAFDWPTAVAAPNYVEFALPAGQRFGLYRREGFAINTGAPPALPPAGALSATEIYLYADDLGRAEARLATAGARQLAKRAPRDWGDEASYYADPDGNVVVVARPMPEGT